jgi:predicted TIM-barrel fold metal-dependent hydrolase
MIYDGHVYCVPDQRGRMGYATREEFMGHLQNGMAVNFEPAWRARDGAPADSSGMYDPTIGTGRAALLECDFRPAGYGRYEWTVDGEDFVRQVMPPTNIINRYTAEQLVAEMDHADVDWGMVHRSTYLGIGNEWVADCVRRFPDRLHGLAHVEEWLIQSQPDAAIAKIETAIKDLGLHGIQWLAGSVRSYGQTEAGDSEGFLPFWDAVAGLGIPVFFTTSPGSDASKATGSMLENYVEDMNTLRRWMERYPDVKVVVTHGLPFREFMEEDRVEMPQAVMDAIPADNPNYNVQILFVNALGGDYDYPAPQTRPVLEQMARQIGADRLMWGTDIPQNLRHYTYRQSHEAISRYCEDILSKTEIDQILGGNMARLMGLKGA